MRRQRFGSVVVQAEGTDVGRKRLWKLPTRLIEDNVSNPYQNRSF
jgi:hypothetical protein